MKKEFTDVDFEMFIMPFGKHQGKEISQLPEDYLLWIFEKDFCPDVLYAYIELNIDTITDIAIDDLFDRDYDTF